MCSYLPRATLLSGSRLLDLPGSQQESGVPNFLPCSRTLSHPLPVLPSHCAPSALGVVGGPPLPCSQGWLLPLCARAAQTLQGAPWSCSPASLPRRGGPGLRPTLPLNGPSCRAHKTREGPQGERRAPSAAAARSVQRPRLSRLSAAHRIRTPRGRPWGEGEATGRGGRLREAQNSLPARVGIRQPGPNADSSHTVTPRAGEKAGPQPLPAPGSGFALWSWAAFVTEAGFCFSPLVSTSLEIWGGL